MIRNHPTNCLRLITGQQVCIMADIQPCWSWLPVAVHPAGRLGPCVQPAMQRGLSEGDRPLQGWVHVTLCASLECQAHETTERPAVLSRHEHLHMVWLVGCLGFLVSLCTCSGPGTISPCQQAQTMHLVRPCSLCSARLRDPILEGRRQGRRGPDCKRGGQRLHVSPCLHAALCSAEGVEGTGAGAADS